MGKAGLPRIIVKNGVKDKLAEDTSSSKELVRLSLLGDIKSEKADLIRSLALDKYDGKKDSEIGFAHIVLKDDKIVSVCTNEDELNNVLKSLDSYSLVVRVNTNCILGDFPQKIDKVAAIKNIMLDDVDFKIGMKGQKLKEYLISIGCNTLGDVAMLPKSEILKNKGMGAKTEFILDTIMNEYGIEMA